MSIHIDCGWFVGEEAKLFCFEIGSLWSGHSICLFSVQVLRFVVSVGVEW